MEGGQLKCFVQANFSEEQDEVEKITPPIKFSMPLKTIPRALK
jgi:hypothetical protein